MLGLNAGFGAGFKVSLKTLVSEALNYLCSVYDRYTIRKYEVILGLFAVSHGVKLLNWLRGLEAGLVRSVAFMVECHHPAQ